MKMIEIKCPACGGELKVEDGLETFYCMHCGGRIILSGQDENIVKAKMVNSVLSHEERIYNMKLEAEEKERADERRGIIIALMFFVIVGVLFGLAFLIMYLIGNV
ncbi:MAG: zf-TFIIB domain-containing protein [Lachnospiraceae bacterium]|nr:zf-TFIIB domain-containing protein [Lachnospiraceae bacterium]